MNKYLVFIVLILVTSCTTINVKPEEEYLCGPAPTYEQAQNAIKTFIERSGLKDPNSAQIRDIRIGERSAWVKGLINGGGYNYGWTIKFEINAKNSFGAYVGFTRREVLLQPDGLVRWRFTLE